MIASIDQAPVIDVLGVQVHVVEISDALNCMESWLVDDVQVCRYVVATGMHGVMQAQKDPEFMDVVNSADMFVADGISLVWLARTKGYQVKKRVSGADLMAAFLPLAEEKGYNVFFYGDTDETLKALRERLSEDHPNLKIAGTYSPPFRTLTPDEDAEEVRMINDSGANVVWVGLGLPKQERWMAAHRDQLNAQVMVGVGAAFKFASGQVRRAPSWIGDNGFEWLWRFVQEPRRVWRRVFIDLPQFTWLVTLELFKLKKH